MRRGHHVEVVKIETKASSDPASTSYQGVPLTIFRHPAPATPVIRNVSKNERLWTSLDAWLTERLDRFAPDIVHAQHVMSTVPSIRAAHRAGLPIVATVRDYWPVCYWSDLIYDPSSPTLCPHCTVTMMTKCVRPRAGSFPAAGWPIIPYMRANLRTKRRTLATADTVIAVSSTIAGDLRRRAPELAATPIVTIPNPVDMASLESARDSAPPLDAPYVLYAGKLATNKGVQFLIQGIADAGIRWPLVVVGDGPLAGAMRDEARVRGVDLRLEGWRDRADVLAWMRHATLLAFPSYGPESLSRVLIEAAALGVAIAAMDTGGTRDILRAGETGLLSTDPASFSRDLARLAGDERLRRALGDAARADVTERFAAASVVERVELVYRGLLAPKAA